MSARAVILATVVLGFAQGSQNYTYSAKPIKDVNKAQVRFDVRLATDDAFSSKFNGNRFSSTIKKHLEAGGIKVSGEVSTQPSQFKFRTDLPSVVYTVIIIGEKGDYDVSITQTVYEYALIPRTKKSANVMLSYRESDQFDKKLTDVTKVNQFIDDQIKDLTNTLFKLDRM